MTHQQSSLNVHLSLTHIRASYVHICVIGHIEHAIIGSIVAST